MKKETKEIKELSLEEKIAKWKKEYRHVYKTIVADEVIIWRGLTRKMHIDVMMKEFDEDKDLDYYAKQEYIAESVMLYPENKKELIEDFAAIADILSTEALAKSGYGINNTTESL